MSRGASPAGAPKTRKNITICARVLGRSTRAAHNVGAVGAPEFTMIARFFSWLEKRVELFPPEKAGMPPPSFWGFIAYYTRPFVPTIMASSVLSAAIALIEVSLFGFLGNLVDWLSKADRATFWSTHGRVSSLWAPSCWSPAGA